MRKLVVITSGGTVESIDSVRSIRNTSSGKLGAAIADAISAKWGADVDIIYMANRFAAKPTVAHSWVETSSVLDLQAKVADILENRTVDIFIHAMAVADYTVTGLETETEFIAQEDLMHSKLSSDNEQVKVVLTKAPKIISMIKKLQPKVYLVGFKLLNEVTEDHLFDVGFNLLRKNRCNLVIANDLAEIRRGEHGGLFIYPEKKYEKKQGKQAIAQYLAEVLHMRAFCKHPKSVNLSEQVNVPQHVLNDLQRVGASLFQKELLPSVEGGTYGNMSIRQEGEFFITGRNVHKGELDASIVCRISSCEAINDTGSTYAHIGYHGTVKPSIDSAIHAKIYAEFPEVTSILHVHTDDLYDLPLTSYNYPCGSMEERDSIVDVITHSPSTVQMKKHGLIMVGDSLTKSLNDLETLLPTFRLSPLDVTTHATVWEEWLQHIQDVGAANTSLEMHNPDNYYVIKEDDHIYGLCYVWLNPTEQVLQFALYTTKTYQKQNKNIGGRVIAILNRLAATENVPLELVTNPHCDVVGYYTKQGFTLSRILDGTIYMRN